MTWLIGIAKPMFDAWALIAVVMPDDFAARVDQRAAAVADADRRVGLDVGVEALDRRASGRGS